MIAVEDDKCPDGEYCILNWKDNQCGVTIGAEGASIIYGRCSKPTLTYDVCLQNGGKEVPNIFATKPCGDGMYCNLKWSDKNCTEFGAEGAAFMYGVCLEKDKTEPMTCPPVTEATVTE